MSFLVPNLVAVGAGAVLLAVTLVLVKIGTATARQIRANARQ